jgi:hypothetical protein
LQLSAVNHALIVTGLKYAIGNFININHCHMKKTFYTKTAFLGLAALALLTSCEQKDERKEAEAREKAKVGKIYNPEEQGIEHENRENQFPYSRNNNKKGEGQETGAKSDTAKVIPQEAQQPVKQ